MPQDEYKKRKYEKDYLKFGFTDAINKRQIVSKCVICPKNLSSNALRPSRSQFHLGAKHPGPQDKFLEFFVTKDESFKRMKMVNSDAFRKYLSSEAAEALFETAYLIALAKKPHNTGRTLTKLGLLTAASLVLRKANEKELAKISLSDSTV